MFNSLAAQLNVSPEILFILIVWTIVWKGLALWNSSRLNQPIWFILLLVINTLGILEIIYLILYSKHFVKTKNMKEDKSKIKKKRRRK